MEILAGLLTIIFIIVVIIFYIGNLSWMGAHKTRHYPFRYQQIKGKEYQTEISNKIISISGVILLIIIILLSIM